MKTFFIDIKPISTNSCWQGRRFRTIEFKKWQEAVIYALPDKKVKGKKLKVHIDLYFQHPLKMDADNYVKAILDCVVKKKIIEDDRYIFELSVKKHKDKIEGFRIDISTCG